MNARSCMGGWCHIREKCALHQSDNRANPHERVCSPKTTNAFEPIVIIKRVAVPV